VWWWWWWWGHRFKQLHLHFDLETLVGHFVETVIVVIVIVPADPQRLVRLRMRTW
jgi:hypothetical protein